MLIRLENKNEIAEAQRLLTSVFNKNMPKVAVHNITYPSGKRENCRVVTNGKYWFWHELYKPKDGRPARHFNWFGLHDENKKSLGITVEVNTYEEGLDRRLGGYFAKNPYTGQVYLMHSGGIGGGKEGQSKNAFLGSCIADIVFVTASDGKEEPAIIVMPLTGKMAMTPAFYYIDKVAAYKTSLRDKNFSSDSNAANLLKLMKFLSESAGRRKGKRSSEIDYFSRHGLIVDALKSWRESQGVSSEHHMANDKLIDLALVEGEKLIELYEVKTSSDTQNVYTAIGQLSVHCGDTNCERYIVLPEDNALANNLTSALSRLKIELLNFQFVGDKIVFKKSL